MRSIWPGILIVSTCCAGRIAAAEVPQFLIALDKKGAIEAGDGHILCNLLAQELDQDGRVTPVVWSLTDPIFRSASFAGKLGKFVDIPSPMELKAVAGALHAKYIFAFSTSHKGKETLGSCELLMDGRTIWKDSENQLAVHAANLKGDDTLLSLAHTWASKLEAIPLRSLSPRPKVGTVEVSKGQAPTTQLAPPPPPATITSDELALQVQKLLEAKNSDGAVLIIRDAIDAHPLDPTFRLLLVHTLESQGQWGTAADEAIRAIEMLPGDHELRFASVSDLMKAGRNSEAKNQLNEMLARKPSDPETMLLRAEIGISVGEVGDASAVLDKLIQTSPSPPAYYWRSLARALLGGADGVTLDLTTYSKNPMSEEDAQEAYPIAMAALGDDTDASFTEILNLFQMASSGRGTTVKDKVDEQSRKCDARAKFLQALVPPASYKVSHSNRLLAQKLLNQAIVDLQDYLKSGSDDSITDGRISLGEARKDSKIARDAFAEELGLKRGIARVESR